MLEVRAGPAKQMKKAVLQGTCMKAKFVRHEGKAIQRFSPPIVGKAQPLMGLASRGFVHGDPVLRPQWGRGVGQ